jgi:hypothetical protein
MNYLFYAMSCGAGILLVWLFTVALCSMAARGDTCPECGLKDGHFSECSNNSQSKKRN